MTSTTADLLSQVQAHIDAAAQYRVGKRRTDPDDIARILYEHGACSTQAVLAVRAAAWAALGPGPDVPPELAEVQRGLDRLAEAGYGPDRYERYQAKRGGNWSELRELERRYEQLLQAINEHHARVTAWCNGWWYEHTSELKAYCLDRARRLLVERGETVDA